MTLVLIGAAAVLQPSIAARWRSPSLLPAVIVTCRSSPAGSSSASWSSAGSSAIGSVLAGRIVPARAARSRPHLPERPRPDPLMIAFGLLLIFLWEVSRRLKSTAADLRSVVAMSDDLSRTMDPQLVGDRIAVHIARAVGADDCALSYWDRADDRRRHPRLLPARAASAP